MFQDPSPSYFKLHSVAFLNLGGKSKTGSHDSGHGSIDEMELEKTAIYAKPNKSLRSNTDSRYRKIFSCTDFKTGAHDKFFRKFIGMLEF